eukprot:GSMAST32.ASY1.ANO1.368.1 assembled CDS
MVSLQPPPSESDLVNGHDPKEVRYARECVEYKPRYQRFIVDNGNFDRQYSHLYVKRQNTLGPLVMKQAKALWENDARSMKRRSCFMDSIIGPEKTEQCYYVFVGAIYKQMKKKPCILNEIDPDPAVRLNIPEGSNFASDDDSLVLEDASGRIALTGATLPVGKLVTGVMCAVRGRLQKDGSLLVLPGNDGICFPGLRPQLSPSISMANRKGKQILLVSGISMGDTEHSSLMTRLLVDFVTGHLGGESETSTAAQIVRVVVVGNSISNSNTENILKSNSKAKFGKSVKKDLSPIKDADAIISELASSVPVDVMPGSRDPTNYVMPQQPLHACLLPRSNRYPTMNAVTNPYHCEVAGISFLGSSGQTVTDALRYRTPENSSKSPSPPLQMMQDMLDWGHIAPTAPDTLGCFPFLLTDPFILKHSPHVFFCGNTPAFDTKIVQGESTDFSGSNSGNISIRVVCVPSFRETGVAVLLSLDTLDATPISFGFGC